MSEEIKPCPFCGGKAEMILHSNWYGYIECCNDECLACGPMGDTEKEAIQNWNQRPYDFDMPAIVKKVQQLEAENKLIKEALEIYADRRNWTRGYVWAGNDEDGHDLANQTLLELKCKQPE